MTTPPLSEEELLDLLGDVGSYPHRPSSVRLIQTHISTVAIAPPFVYKVKKPVDFGFLDFSSLEQRRHFCEEEVRLNRRLCPDTYEGVVPISRTPEGLALESDRNPVEFAVKMKELEDGRFLPQLLERGEAGASDLAMVAAALVSFYRRQPATAAIAEWGRIEKIRISTDENFEQMAPFVGTLLPASSLQCIREYTDRFFQTHEPLFNRRRAEGHILDCHGDLRLEHIHIRDNVIRIFDCIEFNQRLRSIDLANDAAFLAMDLDYGGHPELAADFTDCFLRGMEDPDLRKLLNFYRCYRACVRGKVEGMRSREPEVEPEECARSRERARRYFQLALDYAATASCPVVVVVMGRIGAGKSSVAGLLSEALGWKVCASDPTRKGLAGLPVDQPAPPETKPRLYGEEVSRKTYQTLIATAIDRARRGRSTLLDATFSSRAHRYQLREPFRAAGLRYHLMELTAPETVLRRRLADREHRTAHGSDATLADFDQINASYQEPDALEDAFHHRINAAESAESAAEEILRHLVAFNPDIGR